MDTKGELSPEGSIKKVRGSKVFRRAFVRQVLSFFCIAQVVTGCASGQLGPNRPISIEDDIAWIKPMIERNLANFETFPPDQQAVRRNEIVSARMYLIDLEYNNFE